MVVSVDWSKPLELADGRRVRLLAPEDVPGGANPDKDGDYWVLLPYGRKQCFRHCGRRSGAHQFTDPLIRNARSVEDDEQ